MKKWTLPQISSPKKEVSPFLAFLFEQNVTVSCQEMTLVCFYFGLKMTSACRFTTPDKQKIHGLGNSSVCQNRRFLVNPYFFGHSVT